MLKQQDEGSHAVTSSCFTHDVASKKQITRQPPQYANQNKNTIIIIKNSKNSNTNYNNYGFNTTSIIPTPNGDNNAHFQLSKLRFHLKNFHVFYLIKQQHLLHIGDN